jgi:hypothetical protein
MLSRKRLAFAISAVGVICLVLLIAWQQATWRSWYYAHQLSSAHPEKRMESATKLEHLGISGAQAVVNLFSSPRERACQNAAFALEHILNHWGGNDPRYEAALQYLAEACPSFSVLGQREALLLMQQLFAERKEATASQLLVASRLLSQVGAQPENRLAALEISAQLLQLWCTNPPAETSGPDRSANNSRRSAEALIAQAKAWVVAGLKDDNPSVRVAAVKLAVVPQLHAEELLPPLLLGPRADASPEVRHLVILALGEADVLLTTDQICRFLSDEALMVRLAAERVLRARGLPDNQLKIGKLMYQSDPAARAEVAALVCECPELDSFLWLERLSRDPAPAVRVAAARAISRQQDLRGLTLMRHLASEDADPTVQEIARFFLLQRADLGADR